MRHPNWKSGRIMALSFLLTTLLSIGPSYGQDLCGTHPTPTQINYLTQSRHARQDFDWSMQRADISWMPVKFHIIRQSNGSGGMNPDLIPQMLANLNVEYLSAGLQFFQCGAVNFIDDDTYFDFEYAQEADLAAGNEVANVINLFIPNDAYIGFTKVAGYAYLPPSQDRIVMDADHVLTSTLVHEFGHYFSLYHTHGKTNAAITDELVNGSNCQVAGDDVCDTPADPNLQGKVAGCVYTGSQVDGNGQAFVPDPTNHMSYAPQGCRVKFSPMQLNRIAYSAKYDRDNLTCTSNTPECAASVDVFPYNESWENTLGLWTQNTDDDFNWTINSGGTPDNRTGPSGASAGTWYLYTEASGNNGNSAILTSPCLDLTEAVSPQLTFDYSMKGNQMGTLSVEISDDGGYSWTQLAAWSGDQGNNWHSASISLAAYVGSPTAKIRFSGTIGGNRSDMAIDNFSISEGSCAGTSVSISTTDETCYPLLSGSATANVSGSSGPWTYLWSTGATTSSLSNIGAGLYTVSITDNNNCVHAEAIQIGQNAANAQASITKVSSPAVADGSIDLTVTGGISPYSFAWSNGATTEDINSLAAGNYSLTLTDNGGCVQYYTFGVGYPWCSGSPINTFPHIQGFESGLGSWFNNPLDDDFDWSITSGTTPTANTGPSAAYEGSNYAFIEATGNTGAKEARLETPCFDFTNVTYPQIFFRYNHNGADCQNMYIHAFADEVDYDEDNFFSFPWYVGASYFGDYGDQWIFSRGNLESFAGMSDVKLVIGATTGSGDLGDIAIDDFRVVDCGHTTLSVSVTDESCNGGDGSISLSINGSTGPYTIAWSNGATNVTSISGLSAGDYYVGVTAADSCFFYEIITVGTAPGFSTSAVATDESTPGANDGSIDLTVTGGTMPFSYNWSNGATTQDISGLAPATYSVTVTDNAGCTGTDQATVNPGQQSCSPSVSSYPYSEGFESGLGAWNQNTGDGFDWDFNSGGTPTNNTGPNGASEGSQYLYTEANGNSGTAYLTSDCFDLTSAATASFTFDYSMFGSQMGSMALEISTDQGSNWSTLWSLNGNQGSGWNAANISLNSYTGGFVQLRFAGALGGSRSDMAIDNLGLTVSTSKMAATTGPEVEIAVFPNPADHQISVAFETASAGKSTLVVTNAMGTVVARKEITHVEGMQQLTLPTADLPAGMYFLQIRTGESRQTARFMIAR